MSIPTAAENMTDVLNYLGLVVDHVGSHRKLSQTVKGISKHAGFGIAGTVVGGIVGGPPGAFLGTVIGSTIGYAASEPYDGLLQHVRNLNEEEKADLVRQIRELVGENPIGAFYSWYLQPPNRDVVQTLFIAAIGLAAAASQNTVRN